MTYYNLIPIFMKKFLLLMLVMASAFVGYAGTTGYRSIVFHRTDGSTIAITMEDNMTVNLTNGNVELTCKKGIFSAAIEDVKYWTYSKSEGENDKWAGIENIIGETVSVIVTDDYINLQNLPENSTIGLVAIDGRVIVSDKASREYEISLSELTHGVYVLTYNGKSIKIAVK